MKNRISFTRSLLEFNRRVLHNGEVLHRNYSMKELKDKLFFNRIFLSNTNEMFQKYNMDDIIDDYYELMLKCEDNIFNIIDNIQYIDSSIAISSDDMFERRILMENEIVDRIIQIYCGKAKDIYNMLQHDCLYYVSILQHNHVAISYVDPRSRVYDTMLKSDFPEYTIYWKIDDCIRDCIDVVYDAVATFTISIVKNNDSGMIVKVEYNGNEFHAGYLQSLFPDAYIIPNKYIYTDDINRVVESKINQRSQVRMTRSMRLNFNSIFKEDHLIEFPNDSFDVFLNMLSMSSKCSNVESIYITLYRIGDNPAIFYILRDAVQNGIKVVVNIELYASGETINRMWMKEMIRAGITVVTYRSGELKVHSKLTLIKFSNGRSIAQIGTGNYHTKTTTQYTDLSLITSDENICNQIEKVFAVLTGNEDISFGDHNVLVTRYNAREALIRCIDIQANKWDKGYICFKCNTLDDNEIIKHLNQAARHGCKIDLIVRGVCTWLPDQLGENVKIKSIVWDKLEHSRVYCFGRSNPIVYLGSLDLVTNKIDNRIETLVRIKDPDIKVKLCNYLNRYIINTKDSWIQTSSGMYIKE